MNIDNLQTAVETLEAQNEDGQLDQVITQMKVQLQALQKAEEEAEEEARKEAELAKRIEEEWGLTKAQYDEVVNVYDVTSNPIEDALELNNKQMRLFAHLWVENPSETLVKDYDGEFYTEEEACDMVYENPEQYIDIHEVVNDNFDEVDEEELYNKLVEMRDDEYETDEDGNTLHEGEEDEVS